jgi:hypothetical protein
VRGHAAGAAMQSGNCAASSASASTSRFADQGVRTVDELADIDTTALLAGEYGVEDRAPDQPGRAAATGGHRRPARPRTGAVLRLKPTRASTSRPPTSSRSSTSSGAARSMSYFWGCWCTDADGSRLRELL